MKRKKLKPHPMPEIPVVSYAERVREVLAARIDAVAAASMNSPRSACKALYGFVSVEWVIAYDSEKQRLQRLRRAEL